MAGAEARANTDFGNENEQMGRGVNQALRLVRLFMVVSSLSPLFLLWAIRGAASIPDRYWVSGCLTIAVVPNLVLLWRWRVAARRNDRRTIIVATSRDQSDHLLVYLFAMLLPLYTANLADGRDLLAVLAAFAFITFLFWHMNLHYMNVAFAIRGYRVFTIDMASETSSGASVVLLSRRSSPPPVGASIDGLRLSDTVFVERKVA